MKFELKIVNPLQSIQTSPPPLDPSFVFWEMDKFVRLRLTLLPVIEFEVGFEEKEEIKDKVLDLSKYKSSPSSVPLKFSKKVQFSILRELKNN